MIPKYDPDAAWDGRWETAKFNNRMQVTELGLGNSATDASVWKTDYEYGELDENGNVVTAKNTGNIAKQTLTVPGTSFTQSYKYDSLYRLTEAAEKTGTETNWSQVFNYDCYGNRTFLNQFIGSLNLNTTPAISESSNRFTSTDFGYDKNGNVIADIDQISNLPRQFIFNGDNKQSEVKRDGVTIGRYYYDGEGRRVKKVTDTETTVFVYSAGKLVAEYSTQVSQSPSVAYTTTDHLGTPRVITDQFGQVKARRDFMPFGEELYTGVGGRTGDTGLKYSSNQDDIRQKFTGYQKDEETQLDFAEARMYENRFGRFTAVDPLLASGKSSNPQTFNRFVYVGNNPLFWVDPTGLIWGINDRNQVKWFDKKLGKGFKEFTPEHWQYVGANNRITQLDPNSSYWSYVFPVNVVAPQNQNLDFLLGFKRGYDDSISGARKGAENFAYGIVNTVTDELTGGSIRERLGFQNPLQIERQQYNSLTEAKFGFGTEFGLAVGTLKGGSVLSAGRGSSISVVPEISPAKRNLIQDLLQMQRMKGDVDIAPGTAFEATKLGRAWVNKANVRPMTIKDGIGWTDGIRSFRLQFKPKSNEWKANFQENTQIFSSIRNSSQTIQIKNVHMTIKNMRPLR